MFKIERSFSGKRPDLIEDYTIDKDTVAQGLCVALTATSGVLDAGATGDVVTGVLVANYQFPETDPLGPDSNDRVPALMQPVSKDIPFIADVLVLEAAAGDLVPGELIDIHTGGLGVSAIASVNDDFLVTEIYEKNSDGKATKVVGFFQSTLY